MSLRAKRNVPSMRSPARLGGLTSSVITLPAGMTTSAPAGGRLPPHVAELLHAREPSAKAPVLGAVGGGAVLDVTAMKPVVLFLRAAAVSSAIKSSLLAPPQALNRQDRSRELSKRKRQSAVVLIFIQFDRQEQRELAVRLANRRARSAHTHLTSANASRAVSGKVSAQCVRRNARKRGARGFAGNKSREEGHCTRTTTVNAEVMPPSLRWAADAIRPTACEVIHSPHSGGLHIVTEELRRVGPLPPATAALGCRLRRQCRCRL